MKIGIMQPYFFPYIGYFQLINAVDTYVNLDHVSFMKRSYMTRNTLKNNTPINIPVSGASQNKSCREVFPLHNQEWLNKFLKTIEQLYSKENNFEEVYHDVIGVWLSKVCLGAKDYRDSISFFNIKGIETICNYLDIKTQIISTSENLTTRKRNEGLQDIVKHFGGTEYINAIGGQSLYTKDNFAAAGIDLKFIKMGEVAFDNPYASILDLLFRYDKEHIKDQLNNYTLI